MSDHLVDVRTPLAASAKARVELGRDGVVHVLAGPVTLHLERAFCEELTTILARAMVRLAQTRPKRARPELTVIAGDGASYGQRELRRSTSGSTP